MKKNKNRIVYRFPRGRRFPRFLPADARSKTSGMRLCICGKPSHEYILIEDKPGGKRKWRGFCGPVCNDFYHSWIGKPVPRLWREGIDG